MKCRNCKSSIPDENIFCDLGHQPLSNAYLTKDQLNDAEITYPLVPRYCDVCGLVQLPVLEIPQNIFSDYAYLSGQSQDWIEHCQHFADGCNKTLDPCSTIIEVASNDGTLLKPFKKLGHRVLGIEPAVNVALMAIDDGIPTVAHFMTEKFGRRLGEEGSLADLVVANNVLAHVPDLDDFLAGIRHILKMDGVLSIEIPDLGQLIEKSAFDTIYHEHFSYFSLGSLAHSLASRGFEPLTMEKIPTHGGSLRVTARRGNLGDQSYRSPGLLMGSSKEYHDEPAQFKFDFMRRLYEWKNEGLKVAAYGAAAKGNTLLNYCKIDTSLIDFVVDSTPTKQGKYLPGSHIPIVPPEVLDEKRPDIIILLPWNWESELRRKLEYTQSRWNPAILTPLEVSRCAP